MTDLAVCIATYRGGRRLERLLENLSKCTFKDFETIIFDDASPSDEWERTKIAGNKYGALLYKNTVNCGCATTYNNLVDATMAKNILLLDDDVLIPVDFLEHVHYVLTNNPHLGVAGWKSEKVTEEWAEALLKSINTFKASKFNRITNIPEPATELAGYCFAFRTEVFEKVDGFHYGYKAYIQDSDFCFSAAKLGYYSYRFSYPIVAHMEHASLGAYAELRHQERLTADRGEFTARHGFESTAHAEKAVLGCKTIPPVKWLAKGGPEESVAPYVSRI